MEFEAFDETYLRRLAEGDPAVQEHFAAYFGELLHIKLAARVLSRQLIDDIRQETFKRVLQAIRTPGTIERPDRLGAYVNSVCNNVRFEAFRDGARFVQMQAGLHDAVDRQVDLDAPLITRDRRQVVEEVLADLAERDRKLLRTIFLDEQGTAEACRQLHVKPDYLRVLLHRAKLRFRERLSQRRGFRDAKSV